MIKLFTAFGSVVTKSVEDEGRSKEAECERELEEHRKDTVIQGLSSHSLFALLLGDRIREHRQGDEQSDTAKDTAQKDHQIEQGHVEGVDEEERSACETPEE